MLVVARMGELATGMSVQMIRMVLLLIRTGLDGTVRLHHRKSCAPAVGCQC